MMTSLTIVLVLLVMTVTHTGLSRYVYVMIIYIIWKEMFQKQNHAKDDQAVLLKGLLWLMLGAIIVNLLIIFAGLQSKSQILSMI